MRADVISVIEAGYSIDLPDDEWVAQICERTAAAFHLPNAFSYLYDASGPTLSVGPPAVVTESAAIRTVVEQTAPILSQLPAWLVAALYEPAPRVTTASEVNSLESEESRPAWDAMRASLGIDLRDLVSVRAGGLDRRGLIVAFPLLGGERLSQRTRGLLGRVGAHLAAAYRLRLLAVAPESASAVLSSTGRLLHMSDGEVGGRHTSLAEAIARMRNSRRQGARDNTEESVTAWQALVDGRWSVIDHVDTDGKRLILARRNEPLGRDLLAIQDAERQVLALASLGYPNKQIAYELGLSAGAVTVRLKRGLRRLGLNSRQELIALRAAESPEDPPQVS